MGIQFSTIVPRRRHPCIERIYIHPNIKHLVDSTSRSYSIRSSRHRVERSILPSCHAKVRWSEGDANTELTTKKLRFVPRSRSITGNNEDLLCVSISLS